MNKEELIFCPLGGSGEIGMNMNLYAYGKEDDQKWIIVDMGVTFADDTIPGVDLIMPDPGFIIDKKDDLLGIVLTHAHEDHIGAVAHIWPELKCKLYATPFTAALLTEKFKEKKIDISSLPNDIKVEETPFLEHQDMLRSVDEQRKREDPDFKGAFHDKKWVIKARANGNKAALKGLGKNGLTRSGAVAQGVKTGPKSNGKTAGKPGPKGPDRNNRPGKNSKYKTAAPGNKKKR